MLSRRGESRDLYTILCLASGGPPILPPQLRRSPSSSPLDRVQLVLQRIHREQLARTARLPVLLLSLDCSATTERNLGVLDFAPSQRVFVSRSRLFVLSPCVSFTRLQKTPESLTGESSLELRTSYT